MHSLSTANVFKLACKYQILILPLETLSLPNPLAELSFGFGTLLEQMVGSSCDARWPLLEN